MKQSIYTKLSRGKTYRTIDDSLISKIARQLHLQKPELLRLVDCTMAGPADVATLRKTGVIE